MAPAGYGKTTLLAQWAERNAQAFAWVSLDEGDNDPKVLLTYVAEALNAVEPIGQRVFDQLASPGSSVPDAIVPALGFGFSSMTSPVVLVLDNVHVLYDHDCWFALSVLADHVPVGSRLVLAGRDTLLFRIARPRAGSRTLEVGPSDLALTHEEASSLLRNAGVSVSEDDVAELHRQAEGWPAGLYLAALRLKEGGQVATEAAAFRGDDRLVSEYMESEFLARISDRQRVFLTRTAVLERMCGPLCEDVLDQPGAAATLAYLAQSNLLLVPLDSQGKWYRYHRLFRDMLLAELRRQEPELIPVLRRRAAGWCVRNDLPEEALEYSIAVGDVDTAAGLAGELGSAGLPAGQNRRRPAVAPVAGGPGRDGGTPDGGRDGRVPVHSNRASGRGGAVGRRGRSLAVRGGIRARAILPPRRGPPCCALSCAGTGSSRCAPTPTRPRAASRPRASRSRQPRSCKGSPGSCPVTSTAAMPRLGMRPASPR